MDDPIPDLQAIRDQYTMMYKDIFLPLLDDINKDMKLRKFERPLRVALLVEIHNRLNPATERKAI